MDKHSPFCLIKPLRKSCRIDRYEHGERSMLVFISTVTSMENDRYETTFSRFSGPTHYFMTSPYEGKSSPNQLFLFLLLYYP